jgi:hypothetical protein
MRMRRLAVHAARDAMGGCEWRTPMGVCVEFVEGVMPKQR